VRLLVTEGRQRLALRSGLTPTARLARANCQIISVGFLRGRRRGLPTQLRDLLTPRFLAFLSEISWAANQSRDEGASGLAAIA
jgi:hypothetical protein